MDRDQIIREHLAPMRGIVFGFMLAIPLWIVIGVIVGFLLARP